MSVDSKPKWASKTLWVNVIALLASVSGVVGIDAGLDADAQAQLVVGVMAVVNIVLRLVTHQPIKGGPKDAR